MLGGPKKVPICWMDKGYVDEELAILMNPEESMREVIDACTDCDCCRYLMDTNCLFFPEIYLLWDRKQVWQ